MSKDFTRQTSSQLLRDEQIIALMREKVVEPLVEELNEVVPSYSDLSDCEKLCALLRLNEEHAPHGNYLIADFGQIKGFTDTKCAFYAGKQNRLFDHICIVEGDAAAKRHLPLHANTTRLGIDFDTTLPTNRLPMLLGEEATSGWYVRRPYEIERRKEYDALALPFRIADAAHALRENVLVGFADACRFVAGFDSALTPRRWIAYPNRSSSGQVFGWSVEVRDTHPSNELMLHIAGELRNMANSDSWTLIYNDISDDGTSDPVPLYPEHDPRKRTPRESTLLLLQFIDEYLPQRGYHVGRKGEGMRLTWEQAFLEFDRQYPNRYSDWKTFSTSYYNAKRSRKER